MSGKEIVSSEGDGKRLRMRIMFCFSFMIPEFGCVCDRSVTDLTPEACNQVQWIGDRSGSERGKGEKKHLMSEKEEEMPSEQRAGDWRCGVRKCC
jgi:hypothetical protein